MKQLATILLLITLSLGAQANHPNASVLKISLYDQAAFNITINGKSYKNHATSYHIADLNPGRHYVEIVRFERANNGRGNHFAPGRVIFADYIRIPAGMEITAHINPRQKFIETSRIAFYRAPVYTPRVVQRQAPAAMQPRAFAQLMQTLAQTPSENHRLRIAKQATASQTLNTAQITEIMSTFRAESRRLEYAKFAYPYSVDPHNYFMVNRAFRKPASAIQLSRHLERIHLSYHQ